MADENSTQIWTNGYIVLGASTRIPVEEVSIDLSRDLKEYYNSGSPKAAALIPGNEKIDFKIKRIFSNITLINIYLKRCQFNMVLFNNTADPGNNTTGQQVCALTGCLLEKNNLGTLGKGDPVEEDVSGKALDITFNITEIASFVNPTCNNL